MFCGSPRISLHTELKIFVLNLHPKQHRWLNYVKLMFGNTATLGVLERIRFQIRPHFDLRATPPCSSELICGNCERKKLNINLKERAVIFMKNVAPTCFQPDLKRHFGESITPTFYIMWYYLANLQRIEFFTLLINSDQFLLIISQTCDNFKS